MFRRGVPIAIIVGMWLFAVPADANFLAQASIFSPLAGFDNVTVGGLGVWEAEAADDVTQIAAGSVQTFSVYALTSARNGLMLSTPVAGGSNTSVGVELAGAGSADLRLQDRFAIGAGSSGLDDGDPVQLLVQVRLQGAIQLEGRPSGTSITDFQVNTFNAPLVLVSYTTSGLNPPQDFDVDESWEFVLDTTIGASPGPGVDALLSTDVGGTALDPGVSADNFIVFTAQIRVSPASGFEQIALVSDAGATTTPLSPLGDADGDGVADADDNCVLASNADQTDSDADGIGNRCDADLNNDCSVNAIDLGILKSVFFTSNVDADFNSDGVVNAVDLGIMKTLFFGRPGPSANPNICEPAILAEGTFNVDSTFSFDLDTGAILAAATPPADVFYSVETLGNAFFRPVDGALLTMAGDTEPSYAECVAAPLQPLAVSHWLLDTNTYVCFVSDEGHHGWLRVIGVTDPPLGSATNLDIEFGTWQ